MVRLDRLEMCIRDSTKGQALAGEHTALEAVGQALVLAEQIADLAAADTDITGGAVHELRCV